MSEVNETSAIGNVKCKDMDKDKDKEHIRDSLYLCNICLDTAQDAVVSMCGHLFCWPCLHKWLLMRPNRKLCPVCKAAVNKDRVIPLYGRDNTHRKDPRNKVPPRPAAQRTEPEAAPEPPRLRFSLFMAFGIYTSHFGGFTSMLDYRVPSPTTHNGNNTLHVDEPSLFAIFLQICFRFIGYFLFG